ncbi:tail fiber domain-containing protein [Sphingobium mellinum]|uniref:tail fiber domain-containing protein n=1 Tax=Sphingobium mellinum TaxID=1387166 RepID=UPI0030EE6159
MTIPTISALPTPPSRNDPTNFASRADAFVAAFPTLRNEINAFAAAVLAAASGTNYNCTSSSSVAIGTGSKSFTASTGSLLQVGQWVIVASTASPSNYMIGQVTAYNSGTGALTVNVTATAGSGTIASWRIALAVDPTLGWASVDGSGNVGIGTSSPVSKLTVVGSATDLQAIISSSTASGLLMGDSVGTIRAGTRSGAFIVDVGAERLRIETGGATRPGQDNSYSIGTASFRWSVVYAATGTINTSDERAKQNISAVPEEWLDAWGDVDWSRYKFIDAVQAKGDDARWHIGLIAQAVRDAFAARNLDAQTIGLLCYDDWEEERDPIFETVEIPAVLDGDGKEIEPARAELVDTGETRVTLEAGDRWGLRYDECFALEAAYQRRRLDRIEARLVELEAA